jgi:hypothetical protein
MYLREPDVPIFLGWVKCDSLTSTVDTKIAGLFRLLDSAKKLLSTGRTATSIGSYREGLTYCPNRSKVIALCANLVNCESKANYI